MPKQRCPKPILFVRVNCRKYNDVGMDFSTLALVCGWGFYRINGTCPLLLGNKTFGISSSLRHICAACIPSKIPFFNYDWKKESWNLYFVVGTLLGGFLATQFLSNPNDMVIADATKAHLQQHGVIDFAGMLPSDVFGFVCTLTLVS